MSINQQLIPVLADAYYNGALDGVDMRKLADLLEDVKRNASKSSNPFFVFKYLDIKIGESTDDLLIKILLRLYDTYMELFIKMEEEKLHRLFAEDKERGFKAWFKLYMQAISEWRVRVANIIATKDFPFPNAVKKLTDSIQKDTYHIFAEHWAECLPLFKTLVNCDYSTKVDKAKALILLAEIEIYYNLDLKKALSYINQAKELSPEEPRVIVGMGEYYVQNNQFEQAKKYFKKVIAKDPLLQDGYSKLGYCYEMEGKYDIAEQWYLEAIKKAGDSHQSYLQLFQKPSFYQSNKKKISRVIHDALVSTTDDYKYSIEINIGNIFVKNNELHEGIKWYKKAIKRSPERDNAYISMAYAYLEGEKRDFVKSSRIFQKLIRLNKEYFDGYWGMAYIYELRENWKEALKWYKKSLLYRSYWEPIIRTKIGEMYLKSGNYSAAETEYLRGLKADPELDRMKNAVERLAQDYYKVHDKKDKAILLFNKIGEIIGPAYEAEKYNRIGNVYYFYEDSEALEYYKKACKLKGDVPVYVSNLGGAYLDLKLYKDAIDTYKKAVKLDRTDDFNYNQIGVCYYRKAEAERAKIDYKNSIEWYEKAIKLNPKKAVYFDNLGLSNEKLGNYDEAQKAYFKAKDLDPKNPSSWNNCGLILYFQQKYDEAIPYYNKAIELSPDHPVYYDNLGLALCDNNNWEEGVLKFEKAAELDPGNASYWRSIGLCYKKIGQKEKAMEALKKVVEIDPKVPQDWNDLGLLYYDEQNDPEAIKYYQKAIDLDPLQPVYHANIGLSYGFLDRWEDALREYELVLELDPNNPEYIYRLGFCHFRLREYPDAIKHIKKAISFDGTAAEYWYTLGECYRLSARFKEAIESYKQAIKLDENNHLYYNNLGVAYNNFGNFEEAAKSYKIAIDKFQGNPIYFINLAFAMQSLGNIKEMISAFQDGMKHNSKYDFSSDINDAYRNLINEDSRKMFADAFHEFIDKKQLFN